MDGDIDPVAIAGEMLVDGIVENLKNAMMQAALIGGADVHARALADARQAFEFVDFRGVVEVRRVTGGRNIWVFFWIFGRGGIGRIFGHRNQVKTGALNLGWKRPLSKGGLVIFG